MDTQYAIAVITNSSRSRFLVQRKDKSYSRPHAIAFFGGSIETDETPHYAIEREIVEELGGPAFEVLYDAGVNFVQNVESFAVFEIVLDDLTLDALARQPVYEGERAEICTREKLMELPWLEDNVPVVERYLRIYCALPTTQVGASSEKLA